MIYTDSFPNIRSSMTDKLYGGKSPLDNIIIISIDDESINKIGRWPWDREVFADLFSKTKDAKVIGIDISFFEESDNDEKLTDILSSANNFVLAAELNNNKLYKPIFNVDYGYVNLRTDGDGITRSLELLNEPLPFSFLIYKKGWNQDVIFNEDKYFINFIGKPYSFNQIQAYKVLEDDYDFKDKLVLIGATAPDLHDNFFVPTSEGIPMPGVEIHANILQNLILDNFVQKQSKEILILIVLISGIFGFFILSKLKIYYFIFIALSLVILYAFISIFLFSKHNYLQDLIYFPLSIIFFTGAGIGINYIQEKKQKKFISDAFSKYINKDLLKEILDMKTELKLGGEKRTITIFFSDIRNFTSLSEKLSPEDLVSLINNYLTTMTRIILKNKGTVDKFIGDAVMAFWNAPLKEENHAELACKTAIEQVKALNEFDFSIGIGIHTGEAIVGNIGSEDRFNYTVMGDTINLCSRLEGLTKQYGVKIIISESTHKIIKEKFICRKLDVVKVKGKKVPVVIYELCIDKNEKFNLQFEKALELYLKSSFKQSLKEFESALKIKQDDNSCNVFIDRCKYFNKNSPGKNWDGAFEFK
nr:adenylate/guanylate cyclase domain-containing protein [Candidatus Woesearchaeota archaeon]